MTDKFDDIYCYPGTEILINKQDIKDSKKLADFEKSVVAIKLMALSKKGITGNFDINHFLEIHKFLFEDIYPFAGELRKANISKGYFQFATWEYVKDELIKLLNELKEENYLSNISMNDFAKRLAYYWSELNVLHPFREGNGRVTREFLRQLALKNGYSLNLKNVPSNKLLDASIKSVVDSSELEKEIIECIEKLD